MEANLLAAARKRGRAPPEAIANAPTLKPYLQFYWDAFLELDTCRPLGMSSVGQIPWTAVNEYALRHGITDLDDFDYLLAIIRGIDAVYRNYVREKTST